MASWKLSTRSLWRDRRAASSRARRSHPKTAWVVSSRKPATLLRPRPRPPVGGPSPLARLQAKP